MCWRNICVFSLVTKNVKSRSKMPYFKWVPIFDFQKWKLHFSEENYLKLHKKDTILHVSITFSLKQGQTRTSSGPITRPLNTWLLLIFIVKYLHASLLLCYSAHAVIVDFLFIFYLCNTHRRYGTSKPYTGTSIIQGVQNSLNRLFEASNLKTNTNGHILYNIMQLHF